MLDTLNDGEWVLQAVPRGTLPADRDSLDFTLEFGIPAGAPGADPVQIARFDVDGCADFDGVGSGIGPYVQGGCNTVLAYDADTRYSKRIRRVEGQLFEVMERVRAHKATLPAAGKPPSNTIVTCTNCFPNSTEVQVTLWCCAVPRSLRADRLPHDWSCGRW